MTLALAGAVCITQNRVTFNITHDGAAGDALTITAAQLAAAAAAGGVSTEQPLARFLSKQWAGNDQANARKRLLGRGGVGDELLDGQAHCRVFVRKEAGLIDIVLVDADVDGVDPLQNELNLTTSGGVAGNFLLDVEYQHTLTR